MPKITTFLTFDNQAEDAANFYTSVFRNSKIVSSSRYGDAGPGPKGSLMSATICMPSFDRDASSPTAPPLEEKRAHSTDLPSTATTA